MSKPKLAIVLGSTCAGCDYSLLDLGPTVLDVLSNVELVYWPTGADFKLSDLESVPDGSVDLTIYEGAITNSDNEELAKLVRRKSKAVLAYGSCACFGGIPGLANVSTADDVMRTAYVETWSTDNKAGILPQPLSKVDSKHLELPVTYDTIRALDQAIPVEYYMPGCPPPLSYIEQALVAFLSGKLPPPGYVFASERSLCDECKRTKEKKNITEIKRFHEIIPDSQRCLLEQAILCMGPATRGGCKTPCVDNNIPCRGCMGPTPEALDQGAKMLSALASILALDKETGVSEDHLIPLIQQVKDPLGTFYRFGLPKSMFRRVIPRR